MLIVISLGAGVQSTTMTLMAAHGELTPMPDCAIFADTRSEPAAVYRHLDWLEARLPFPVYRVSAGSLSAQIIGAMLGRNRMDARPPFFVKSGGMLRRQCTDDFKLTPIRRKIRELIGLRRGQRGPKQAVVEQWIGISSDEAARMKPSRYSYIRHRWPLIEIEKSRNDCLRWNDQMGYPRPPKSACVFCPYADNGRFREMQLHDSAAFAAALEIDRIIRPGLPGPNRPHDDQWFVHRSRSPLAEIDFSRVEGPSQSDLFNDECEGMCGV